LGGVDQQWVALEEVALFMARSVVAEKTRISAILGLLIGCVKRANWPKVEPWRFSLSQVRRPRMSICGTGALGCAKSA